MNNFIVSARKYRPTNFKTVVGQDYIVTTLKNAIKNDQLAQAFLFCGPRGVGKTTCARILAKTINCTNITEDTEACNECQSCKSFNESASFNVHELDAASNNSVDDIRTLVDQVRIPPQSGKYKIYIIDEVHMLSVPAFNAFLKTLEEPPSYAKFILATTERHKIIPTILSRCQIFDFKRIGVDDTAKHLAWVAENEKVDAEFDALQVIANKSDGALRDALSIFDQMVSFGGNIITYKSVIENLNILDYDYFFKLIDQILEQDITSILLTINDIYDKGFDGQSLLSGMSTHIRNLLVAKDNASLPLLEVPHNIINNYKRQSEQCSNSFLIKSLETFNESDVSYRLSTNKRFHVELAFLKAMQFANSEIKQVKVADTTQEPAKNQHIAKPAQNDEITKPVQNQEISKTPESSKSYESVKSYEVTDNKGKKAITEVAEELEQSIATTTSISNLSVKDLMKKTSIDNSNQVVDNKEFTKEILIAEIQTFLQNHSNNPHLKNIIDFLKIEQINDTQYSIAVNSNLSYEEIKKADIQTYLRKALQNKNLIFEPIVERTEDSSKIISRSDQIKEIITSDPILLKFVKDLQLRPE